MGSGDEFKNALVAERSRDFTHVKIILLNHRAAKQTVAIRNHCQQSTALQSQNPACLDCMTFRIRFSSVQTVIQGDAIRIAAVRSDDQIQSAVETGGIFTTDPILPGNPGHRQRPAGKLTHREAIKPPIPGQCRLPGR